MVCSRCGSNIPVSANSCPRCNASRARTTATGLQTPPPPIAQTSDTARLADGDAPTIFSLPPPASSADLPPPALSADGGQTIGPDLGNGADIDPELTIQPGSAGTTSSDHGPLDIGSAFGARYHIIRLLGIGGMGAVYQAWDAELGVAVAIKVIRSEVMADPTAAAEVERRFKRELLLARQVTHKNVVRIHDIGEMHGIKYITMPYVDGADLATISKNEGHLPVPRVLRIARGIVSGLVAAHTASVVHRDLKPANIMIGADDEAMIMDFGIALSSGAPSATATVVQGLPTHFTRSAAKFSTTMAGAVVGTVEYMAPEQARGQTVDQRADIYAFGLILYDLLVGRRRAEHAPSAIAELQGRMEQPPPPPRTVVPEIPEALDHMVARCLEPDPAKRYQTSAELAAALDRLDDAGEPIPIKRVVGMRFVAVGLAVALTLLGGTWWYARKSIPRAQHEPVSVLIADFENSTRDPAFDGVLEQALSTSVETASFITTYRRDQARDLVVQLKAGDKLDEKAARVVSMREGVKVILAGAIQPKGSGYTISVKAIDPANGSTLGTATGSATSKSDVLKAVGPVAVRIRGVLGDTTPESEKRAAAETVTTGSLEAYQAYDRGQGFTRSNRLEEAIAAFQQAVAFDPGFGRAYAGMAAAYDQLKDEGKTRAAFEEALKRVDRMTEREKYRTLGTYYLLVARNYEKAVENFETLLKRYPADSAGHANLGMAYMLMGSPDRAAKEGREYLKIYPKNSKQRYNLAMYLMYAGNFKDAIAEGSRVIAETPSFGVGYLSVALSKLASGDTAGALETYDHLEAAAGATGARLARLGRADLAMYHGKYREAQTLVANAISLDRDAGSFRLAQDYVAAAQAATALGQKKPAADAALKAVMLSSHESVLLPAALVLIEVGRVDEARKITVALENMLQAQTTAYARVIVAEIAAREKRYGEAIEAFRDSIKRRDTWFARYLLGRAYAETGHFPEALSELELAVKRNGEVTDVFVFDTPTLRYLPPAYYWLARSQQATGGAGARKTYEQYLALRATADPTDPLAADAKRRLAAP